MRHCGGSRDRDQSDMPSPKVLLIGWDAADWKIIRPLIREGKMPALQRLIEGGTSGNLATLQPVLSPILWTSIATGKRPFKHGIHGFSEPAPDGRSVRPITNLNRKTKAIWNILSQEGLKSNVVGWWPSHPAEPISGAMVSNHFQRASGPAEDWLLKPGTVYPESLGKELKELRFHPDEVSAEMVLPFIPRAGEIDQKKESRLRSFAKIFSDCTTVHAAVTHLMENQEWDFTAVYYDAIDHFSHGFMKFHPPRQEGVSEADFEMYRGVVEGAYRYHDMMLERLLQLAGDETTIVLMSDHGFHPDHLRPKWIPRDPAGPAIEHREHGIFVISGPGIQKGHTLGGAGVLDVMPTLLALFQLPQGEDLDGRVLTDVFVSAPKLEMIPSWDDVPGEAGMHPVGKELDLKEEEEALRQLEDLGYIEKAGPHVEINVLRAQRELDFNLAVSYMHANRHRDAISILERVYRNYPGEYRIGLRLALCYQAVGDVSAMRDLVEGIHARRQSDAAAARASLLAMRGEIGKLQNQESPVPLSGLIPASQLQQIRGLQSLARINGPGLDFLRGFVLLASGKALEAKEIFSKITDLFPDWVGAHVQLGNSHLKLGRAVPARKAFERARALDPENIHAILGVIRSYLHKKDFEAAKAATTEAIALSHHNSMAHFLRGQACFRSGEYEEAILSFETALAQNPNFPQAHQRLAFIYQRILPNPVKSARHRALLAQSRFGSQPERKVPVPPLSGGGIESDILQRLSNGVEPELVSAHAANGPITIVTGLPRSGTSLVMQILQAGGLEITTDGKRMADEDNPKGYFEDERVKALHHRSNWILGEGGKVIKVVTELLPFLPKGPDYRVIFVQRNLDEVLHSQRKMLLRRGETGANLTHDQLRKIFSKKLDSALSFLEKIRIPMISVEFSEFINCPDQEVRKLLDFIPELVDPRAMLREVVPSFYRNRSPKPPSR